MSSNSYSKSNNSSNNNKFICPMCNRPYLHKFSLNRHINENHISNEGYYCKFCGKKIRINDHEKRCQLKLLLKKNKNNDQHNTNNECKTNSNSNIS